MSFFVGFIVGAAVGAIAPQAVKAIGTAFKERTERLAKKLKDD